MELHSKPVFGIPAPAAPAKPRVRPLNRNQFRMLNLDVERLIPEEHPARAIWDLVGRVDLSPFYEKVKAVEGHAGQPPFDPRLMVSIWVYGGSAPRNRQSLTYNPVFGCPEYPASTPFAGGRNRLSTAGTPSSRGSPRESSDTNGRSY